MRPRHSSASIVAFAAFWAISAQGLSAQQPPRSLWQGHEQLLEWTGEQGVERLSEGASAFVRFGPGVRADLVGGHADRHGCAARVAWERVACPVLLDPRAHDAVRLTLRHTRPWSRLGGRWVHRRGQVIRHEHGGRYLQLGPSFGPVDVPGDGQWHDVTLRLTDSALFDPSDPVVWMEIGPFDPGRDGIAAEVEPQGAPTGFVDLARVEFLPAGPPVVAPVVTSVSPRRSPQGAEVTIRGSGFAVPAERNMVLFGTVRAEGQIETVDEAPTARFGQTRAEVLSGDATSLRVRIAPRFTGDRDVAPLEVRTPGGGRVVVDPQYVLLGSGRTTVLGGGSQRAPVGTRLPPLTVRVTDHLYGVPGLRIPFRIAWGGGTLSASEATTDEDGMASTVLTLGPAPGPVILEVGESRTSPPPRGFIATPTSSGPAPQAPGDAQIQPLRSLTAFVAGALHDPSTEVRRAAAMALRQLCTPVYKPGLPAFDLGRGDPVGPPHCSENALAEALEDPEREVRVAAILGLGWMRQRASLRRVERARDAEVSRAARLALAMSERGPLALPELRLAIATLAGGDGPWREVAAIALGRQLTANSPALPALRAALRDPEAKVRKAAAYSLEATRCGDSATLTALAETRQDADATVREAATRATSRLELWQRFAGGPRADATTWDYRPALMGLYALDLEVSRRTAATLARRAPEGLGFSLEPALHDAQAHPDAQVRGSAAMALAGLKLLGREVRPGEVEATHWLAVLRALEDADPDVRAWAGEARLRLPAPPDTALPRIAAGLGWNAARGLQRLGLDVPTALTRIRAAVAAGAPRDAFLYDDGMEAEALLEVK